MIKWFIKPKKVGLQLMYIVIRKDEEKEICCGYFQSYEAAEHMVDRMKNGIVL